MARATAQTRKAMTAGRMLDFAAGGAASDSGWLACVVMTMEVAQRRDAGRRGSVKYTTGRPGAQTLIVEAGMTTVTRRFDSTAEKLL